ncbi:MAG: HisA/HisF-related TIM barrel protein [Bdellovibrio sp.]
MLKKRLIFILYFDTGYFFLSRNFRLQRVGDVNWLVDKFRFKTIGKFIDEIVILDVNRSTNAMRCDGDKFKESVSYLMRETFVPLTLGGGINTVEDAQRCFALGADKILLNTAVLSNPMFVKECVTLFGAQAVVAALDVFKEEDDYLTKVQNGEVTGSSLQDHLDRAISLGVGEILINSIDRDGTGSGFDLNLIESFSGLQKPLILAGGAGKPEHFAEALKSRHVEAVATGHLFNFMGKGFESARKYLIEGAYPVRSI